MSRKPRIILPNVPVKLIQETTNNEQCFYRAEDHLYYLKGLQKYAQESGCAVHAYVLMPNHIRLLVTPADVWSVAHLMKHQGQMYTLYVNRVYQRKGSLWDGRFRSCVMDQENYLLVCQRFIEMSPVFSGLVSDHGEYPWSSYRANAYGEKSRLVEPHSQYLMLGSTANQRQAAYRKIFKEDLRLETIQKIQKAANGNYALGDKEFIQKVAHILGRRVTPGKAGRPRKKPANRGKSKP